MNYFTNICGNCGADSGLHHFETEQCPKNGIEEWRDDKKQEWQNTYFIDSGLKKLQDAAPALLEALKRVREMIAIKNGKATMNTSPEFVKETIEAAIKKATE